MHWSCIHGLTASAGVLLRANEIEISAAILSNETRERLYFFKLTGCLLLQPEKTTDKKHSPNGVSEDGQQMQYGILIALLTRLFHRKTFYDKTLIIERNAKTW